MKIGAVDLFCGIGGLTYGLQKTGIEVAAGIDLDNDCEYAFTSNNKSIFINKNVEDVTGNDLNTLWEPYDVRILVGCAPCQPFSSHQKDKKNRSRHKDWRLLYEFSRLVIETKPDIISMENVPELIKEEVFLDFVKTLKSEKYYVNYQIVNVADYGVPQRRKRLILLASNRKNIELVEKTHHKFITVKDAISHLSKIKAGESDKIDPIHVSCILSESNLERIKCSKPGGTWKDWPERLILNCHKKETGKSYSSVYGRMKWNDVAPTITTQFITYGTGRFGHPVQNRALSLREGALLQSFPENYSFISDDEKIILRVIARHIGNAVPPRLGEIIGLSIINHLNDQDGEIKHDR